MIAVPPTRRGRRRGVPKEAAEYNTRIDQLRRREGIGILRWKNEAGMSRTQFNRYRSGRAEPNIGTLAVLLESGSRIARKSIRPSALVDLGEDVPVATTKSTLVAKRRPRLPSSNTPLDRLFRRLNIAPSTFAPAVPMPRQSLRRACACDPRVLRASTVRRIVSAFRRHGYDIRASDVVGDLLDRAGGFPGGGVPATKPDRTVSSENACRPTRGSATKNGEIDRQ